MIEILGKNKMWEQTDWESFDQLKIHPYNTYKTWPDNNYSYTLVKFLGKFELYRQKMRRDIYDEICKPNNRRRRCALRSIWST